MEGAELPFYSARFIFVFTVTQSPWYLFQEREKNAGVDVTHLEIPADLALVFANLQGEWGGRPYRRLFTPCRSAYQGSEKMSHISRLEMMFA